MTNDGAVPVHFKAYNGNQTDDGIHIETWNRIRTLLQRPDFIYVADCKLCSENNLRTIDSEHGFFVTIVPRNRGEVTEFNAAILAGNVRWQQISPKESDDGEVIDVIEQAVGIHLMREGFLLHWYRSSQKKKRDERERSEKIEKAQEHLASIDLKRMRGKKTDASVRKRVDEVLSRYHANDWIDVDIKWDPDESYKKIARGRPKSDSHYRRILAMVPRLHVRKNVENIARSAAMDGVFPLTTNTKKTALEVYRIYKYQPKIEKRHALLKSTLDVAPMWLKKNTRIEALMFVHFVGQLVAALVERALRQRMGELNIEEIHSLPESRASSTPTIEQVLRLFDDQTKQVLYDGKTLVKEFGKPLSKVQLQILDLLKIPTTAYHPGK